MLRAVKKPAVPAIRESSWPPRLAETYRAWMLQAGVFRASGYVNEPLFARLVEDLAWQQEYRRRAGYEAFKFVSQWLGALLLVVLFSPVLITCYAINKLTSKGPAMFYQLRSGRNAKPIWIYKFRTFRVDAQSHLKSGKPMAKPLNTDSYTAFGRLMRNWRLDELPQLFNVLRGEMSLIGPRPLSLEDSVTIPRRYFSRFSTRPGLTGLWQATRPNDISARHKLRFDCYYVRHRSFALDLWLLAKTVGVGLAGEERFNRNYHKKKKRTA
jgi:lipopolysaccharide/colanic/teichoic acid biosynthesis glycosyltransferase